jgi:hypothetical protein
LWRRILRGRILVVQREDLIDGKERILSHVAMSELMELYVEDVVKSRNETLLLRETGELGRVEEEMFRRESVPMVVGTAVS